MKETSVFDLTEETYDYLLQESKNQGIESDSNEWLPKTILTIGGNSPNGEVTGPKIALSIFDTFSRMMALGGMIH